MIKSTLGHTRSSSFFDLRASFDIAQVRSIVEKWQSSDKTESSAKTILKDFLVQGTVVISDSTWLSKLSKEKPLTEVLHLIQQPKECLYAYGSSIGGVPMGMWAADNTTMFYPDTISVDSVLSMLQRLQKDLMDSPVQIGIGVHTGSFYRIWDALYGDEYAKIEHISETQTHSGEILLSEQARNASMLPSSSFLMKKDISNNTFFQLVNASPDFLPPLVTNDYHICLPFPLAFHRFLVEFSRYSIEKIDTFTKKYLYGTTVVLLDMGKVTYPSREVALLESITRDFEMKKRIKKSLKSFWGREVKTGESMSIVIFDSGLDALSWSNFIRDNLSARNIPSRIGIAHGSVLLFNLGKRGYEIAWMPVNIASKLAQDFGEYGSIYVTRMLLEENPDIIGWKPFSTNISSVEIHGKTF